MSENDIQQTMHPIAALWSMIGGGLALVALVAGLIASWQTFQHASSIVVTILIFMIGVIIPIGVLVLCVSLILSLVRKHRQEYITFDLARQRGAEEIERLKAETDLLKAEAEVRRRTITFDGVGNAAIIEAGQVMQIRGNYQEHPALSSMHAHNDVNAFAKMLEMGRTVVTPVDEAVPGMCTFSDVLRTGFLPRKDHIFLCYLAGAKVNTTSDLDLCHMANVGATRGGKSSNIRLIVPQLLAVGDQVVLLNPHYTDYDIGTREDWTPIKNKLLKPPVMNFEHIARWLDWAANVELRRRITCYNNSQPWGKPLYIVIDELPSIVNHVKGAMACLADLLREGAKVHLFVITAAQDMLVKTLDNAPGGVRDCFRTAFYVGGDATSARKVLDLTGPIENDEGLGKGLVMVRSSQCKKGTLARVPYADNEALYSLLGPSTFDFSKVVDADPTPVAPMEELPVNNVSVFPVAKEQRKEVTLDEAIEAWNEGYQTVRSMAEYLGITRYQAETFCRQIRDMSKAVSD